MMEHSGTGQQAGWLIRLLHPREILLHLHSLVDCLMRLLQAPLVPRLSEVMKDSGRQMSLWLWLQGLIVAVIVPLKATLV
jgi:hypothetical protein